MDNKQALLDHALRLFSQRGYDAVGVQEIVEETGVTKPTLYHYFGSKQGLLETLLKNFFDELTALLREPSIYTGDLTRTLEQIAAIYFQFAKENPAFYRLQLGLWFAPRESEGYLTFVRLSRFQFDLLENIFKQAANDHGNMRGRHTAYALTFLGLVNNYAALGLNGFCELDSQLVYQAVHQFQHGIYS